jgi:hypothetical protein
VAEHSINFKSTTVLARATGYMDHLLKEAVEIQLHSNNFMERYWIPSKMFTVLDHEYNKTDKGAQKTS